MVKQLYSNKDVKKRKRYTYLKLKRKISIGKRKLSSTANRWYKEVEMDITQRKDIKWKKRHPHENPWGQSTFMGSWARVPMEVPMHMVKYLKVKHQINRLWKCLILLLLKSYLCGTSLVAQWLRIRLPMQGTWVWALVQEDPTCHGATTPMHHSYWACALEPVSHNYWARVLQLLKTVRLESMLCNKRSHCSEKPTYHNEEQPPLTATRESPRAATKTQRSQK